MATAFTIGAAPTSAVGTCNLSPGTKLEGHVVGSEPAYALLAIDGPAELRVLCPSDAFAPSAAP